jgi:AraC family transcriptional regulator of adaptative response/methylated-DNA-[protein]-cysteine methyltransferase
MANGTAIANQRERDYERIEKILLYLESHTREKPSLEQLAKIAGLSPFHFQRLFKRWVGISPKQFLDMLTMKQAKQLLEDSRPLLETSLELGLSGPSRLHDLFLRIEAMTPGEYKKQGEGLTIGYGFFPSPFGETLIAFTAKGICELSFLDPSRSKGALQALKKRWPLATFEENSPRSRALGKILFERVRDTTERSLSLLLKGTEFQLKVWQALLRIPEGTAISYEELAKRVNSPQGHRAVAGAVAKNPIAYLIPCHRVIRKMGDWGGYRWGLARKKALLGWEVAQKNRRVFK